MAKVKHTVNIVYGIGTGTTTILCDENDDLETVTAKVVKQEGLNYLPTATPKITIEHTERGRDLY
ncbi:hypothetical protein [Pontibacter sp. BT731]|uniref:hypothetical protein n=1 Tax=Pontibacter coccineus TaxID=3063328 RepID=UPI0026E1B291|nr:hypothetical protein [Pontibacter sp. BT731]